MSGPRRFVAYVHSPDAPGAGLVVRDLFEAARALGGAAGDQPYDLAYALTAAPILAAPLYHHALDGVAFVSNCTAAYLLARTDMAVLRLNDGGTTRDIAAPPFVGPLPRVQEQLIAWAVDQVGPDLLSRIAAASEHALTERHRRLALLRGHLTAMRWTRAGQSDSAASGRLEDLETRVSALLARESRAWA